MVLATEVKKKSTLSHVLQGEEEELREDRAYDCGCTSWSPLRDAVGSFKKELIRIWNSILPEPGQPSTQLSKLILLTACKKTKHTVSRWYRTVYIPWLVASYDTHKDKRWLNSNPPKPQGEATTLRSVAATAGVLLLLPEFCCRFYTSAAAIGLHVATVRPILLSANRWSLHKFRSFHPTN